MKRNIGVTDRKIRGVAAVVLAVVAVVVGIDSVAGAIALVLAGILAVTAAAGFCPLYAPLHLNTDKHR
jgi:hypothetical protein